MNPNDPPESILCPSCGEGTTRDDLLRPTPAEEPRLCPECKNPVYPPGAWEEDDDGNPVLGLDHPTTRVADPEE